MIVADLSSQQLHCGMSHSTIDYAARGLNLEVEVHPIPTFDNLTALDAVVERMQELGLYLMYDMRW